MAETPPHKPKFITLTLLNLLWIFVSTQLVAVLVLLNLQAIFPRTFSFGHPFVLDSAEYIEEIYYYGSGPEEVDERYINDQWYEVETTSG